MAVLKAIATLSGRYAAAHILNEKQLQFINGHTLEKYHRRVSMHRFQCFCGKNLDILKIFYLPNISRDINIQPGTKR